MEDSKLKALLQEKLQRVEAPVEPGAWEAISQQLPAAPGASGAAASTAAASSSVSVAAIISGAAIALAVVATTVFFMTEPDVDEQVEQPVQTEIIEDLNENEVSPNQEETDVAVTPTEITVDQNDATESSELVSTTVSSSEQLIGTDPAADTITLETVLEVPTTAPSISNEAQNIDATAETTHNETQTTETPTTENAPVAHPDLSAGFTYQQDVYDEMTMLFNPDFPEGIQYNWMFGDGSVSKEQSPQHAYDEEGTYDITLTVVDENGFTTTQNTSIEVYLPAKLVLPNLFTPNGDGINDYLVIGEASRNVEVLKMMVYDANGKVVFEQFGDGNGWDGNANTGNECATGTYRLIVVAKSHSGQQFNESRMVRLQR